MSAGKPHVVALVPMKPLAEAKSRLRSALDEPSRSALSLHLLDHVLRAIAASRAIAHACVVGGDEPVRQVAAERSAAWRADPWHELNAALRHAAGDLLSGGADAVLVLPADLPLLSAEDVDRLVAASPDLTAVVLAGADTDWGTNAMLIPSNALDGPFFGPGSFQRHLHAARAAGRQCVAVSSPGLAFDLDTSDDLERYRTLRPDLSALLEPWRQRLTRAEAMAVAGREPGA